MSHSDEIDRRDVLTGAGAVAVTALAGCSSNGDGSGGGDGDGGGSGGGADISSETRSRVDAYLEDDDMGTDNYDSIEDMTGMDEVTVDVGAQGNDGNFAFAPPAIAISAGTTVSWQWTGEGGQHNVVSSSDSDFDFDSGDSKESGNPFEQSFNDTGVGLYVCEPHKSVGMRGAVVVE